MTKNEAKSLNPRCRDILNDAEKATQEAIAICDLLLEEFERELHFASAIRQYFQNHLEHVNRIRVDCAGLNHDDDNHEPRMMYHRLQMENLVGAPLRRSNELNVLQAWTYQQRTKQIQKEIKFAERLISDILSDLRITATPRVVFSHQAQFLDLESHFIVTVPLVHFRTYERWWVIGHEIGHLYFNRNKDIEINDLLEILVNSIPEEIWEERKTDIEKIIYIWIRNWLPEIIADYVALSFFGLFYLVEVHHIDSIELGRGGITHPPLSFRRSCLRHMLIRNEIDTTKMDSFFDDDKSSERLDQVLNKLLSDDLAPIVVEWILKQTPYASLVFRWHEIHTIPKNCRVSSLFAAISMKSYESDTSEEFDTLRRKLMS